MYISFDLKSEENGFTLGNSEEINNWERMGEVCNSEIKEKAKKILIKYLNEEIIDGSTLVGEWFKVLKSDIFISHSHNDRKLALIFAGWLKDRIGLNVFVDEMIWGAQTV